MATASPVLNPVVLQNLFAVCDLTDLRRFRLVCKAWHDVSLPRWRNEIVVYLVSDKDFDPEPIFPHHRPHLSCANAKLLYENPSIVALPFRKFDLQNWLFADADSGHPPIYQDGPDHDKLEDLELFWEHCGPWMHHLQIDCPQIHSSKAFRRAIVVQTPNLKSLDYEGLDAGAIFDEDGQDGFDDQLGTHMQPNLKFLTCGCDPPWKYLFKRFPNMEEICWYINDEGACIKFASALEEWSNVNGPERKLIFSCEPAIIIRDLGLEKKYTDAMKHILPLKQLKFKHLGVYLNGDGGKKASLLLSKCLDVNKETLESVEGLVIRPRRRQAVHAWATNEWEQQNPFQVALPFLRKLNLDSYNFIPNLQLLHYTRNLHELKLCAGHLGLQELIRRTPSGRRAASRGGSIVGELVLEKLNVLEIEHFSSQKDLPFSELEMKIIVKFAPNVKCFSGPLNNTSFRVVCQSWKDLRKLETNSNQLNDEGITGMVSTDEDTHRLPNITDLKYLHQFWTDERDEDPSLLSDTSIWNGFLQLEYLHNLQVQMSGQTSNKAFSALFARFPSIHVVRFDDENQKASYSRLNERLIKKAEQLAKDYNIGNDNKSDPYL